MSLLLGVALLGMIAVDDGVFTLDIAGWNNAALSRDRPRALGQRPACMSQSWVGWRP